MEEILGEDEKLVADLVRKYQIELRSFFNEWRNHIKASPDFAEHVKKSVLASAHSGHMQAIMISLLPLAKDKLIELQESSGFNLRDKDEVKRILFSLTKSYLGNIVFASFSESFDTVFELIMEQLEP